MHDFELLYLSADIRTIAGIEIEPQAQQNMTVSGDTRLLPQQDQLSRTEPALAGAPGLLGLFIKR